MNQPLFKFKYFSQLYLRIGIIFLIFLFITTCTGKTANLVAKSESTSFLPPNKKKIFIAYPINHTTTFGLDQKIRQGLTTYFQSHNTSFRIVDQLEDATSYMIIKIYNYQLRTSVISFHNAEAVNRLYIAQFEVTLQDPPVDLLKFSITGKSDSNITTYIHNQKLTIRKYDYLDLLDPLQNQEQLEKEFLDTIGKNIEILLTTGSPPPNL